MYFYYHLHPIPKPIKESCNDESTEEAAGIELPNSRILSSLSFAIHPQATVLMEWPRDDDYDRHEGGTGEQTDTVTLQLAAQF